MTARSDWSLLSSHGDVLFHIAAHPDATIRDISDAMGLTRRTVWSLTDDLRQAGMLHVRTNGRRHHYTVNLEAPFRHPVVTGVSLRQVLAGVANSPRPLAL